MANVSEILDSINGNVLTGGRRTKASGVRETFALIAESYLNKEDDADVAGGYLKISDTEIVDVSFIKKASPTGQFLKDDGTWADAESLNTNTVFLSNDNSTYNSGWADGDTLLAEKNTIYYLQNASPGETLDITIDETDVPVGSMVAFTDGQTAGNGINGTARILGVIPSGADSQVYSGETLVYRYDGFDWRLMMRYSRNLISQSIASDATRFAPSSDAVFTALAGKVDTTRTLTINGVTQNLAANRTWTIDALPSQSGNNGKFLTTNGSVASWASLSSANITDALTYTPVNKAGDTLSGFLTLHADPTNSMHAVSKNYVDNLLTGLTWKEKVRVATTANITLSGTQTIDGVSVIAGDRVLVKNQTTQTENGFYIVSASSWTRSNDADTGAEILTAAVLVTAGTTQANTQWTCSNSTTPTIGSTNITFTQIAGAGVYTNGTGISLSGNAFSLDLTRVASGSVTGLLSASDWSVFNGKFNTPTGLTANRLQYWNGTAFIDSRLARAGDDSTVSFIPTTGSNTLSIGNAGIRLTGGNIDIVSSSFDGLLVTGRIISRNSDNYAYQVSGSGSNFYFGLGGTNTGVFRTVSNICMSVNDNGVAIGASAVNSATQIEFQSTTKGAGLNLVTTANLPSYSTRRGNLAFDDTLKTPVISLDRASNATSSWFEIATANRATKAATAADGGAITNWSGNTDYFYTTTVTGAKLGQNVIVNFDATLGVLINGTNVAVNAYVSATNTVIVWVRTGTYVPPTTLSGNFLISVI